MHTTVLKKYAKYSLKLVIISLIFSAVYYICAERTLFSNIIYIILFAIIAQINNIIASYRGDCYIKKHYKNLYDMYHMDNLITPDNIVIQIVCGINIKKAKICKEANDEKSVFLSDENYSVIKLESLIAMAHGLFTVIYGFVFLAISFLLH